MAESVGSVIHVDGHCTGIVKRHVKNGDDDEALQSLDFEVDSMIFCFDFVLKSIDV